MLSLQLPKILEPFREKMESTLRSTVRIHPKAEAPSHLWQSKIGGTPYWPKTMDYPLSAQGRALFFLAQINFAEMPALAPFPTQGIVQFFIADDDAYGLDFDHPGQPINYRVIFHPEPSTDESQLETAFAFLPQFDDYTPFPAGASYALDFRLDQEYLGPPDYQFDIQYPDTFLTQFGAAQDEIMDFFYELGAKASGHKLGGYAFFTQYDPRSEANPMLLLFQLDSDDDINCIWGDVGIANFFIRPEDLAQRRFDRVLYNWDCS